MESTWTSMWRWPSTGEVSGLTRNVPVSAGVGAWNCEPTVHTQGPRSSQVAFRYRKGKSDTGNSIEGPTGRTHQVDMPFPSLARASRDYAQVQGLGYKGPHPGRQPDEGTGSDSSRRATRNTRRSHYNRPHYCKSFVLVVWTTPRRRRSTHFDRLPAVIVDSMKRFRSWRSSWNDSPKRQRPPWLTPSARPRYRFVPPDRCRE